MTNEPIKLEVGELYYVMDSVPGNRFLCVAESETTLASTGFLSGVFDIQRRIDIRMYQTLSVRKVPAFSKWQQTIEA